MKVCTTASIPLLSDTDFFLPHHPFFSSHTAEYQILPIIIPALLSRISKNILKSTSIVQRKGSQPSCQCHYWRLEAKCDWDFRISDLAKKNPDGTDI